MAVVVLNAQSFVVSILQQMDNRAGLGSQVAILGPGKVVVNWLIKFAQILAIIWKIRPAHSFQMARLYELANVR